MYRKEGVREQDWCTWRRCSGWTGLSSSRRSCLYLERGEGGQSEGEVSGPVCGEGGGLISAEEWAAVSG